MDTGARPTSGWVYMYVISNGSVTASLGCATSPTSAGPSMPGGYTYAAYAGAMWLDGSQNLFRQRQRSRRTQYVVTAATNTTVPPVIANGTAGTWSATNPTLAAVSVTSVVPLTAGVVFIVNTMKYHAGSAAHILAAPNTSWGGTGNGPAGSNNQGWPVSTDTAAPNQLSMASFILEATTVAWASDAAGGAISGFGWEDSYSAG
jgi:hypothetical protein